MVRPLALIIGCGRVGQLVAAELRQGGWQAVGGGWQCLGLRRSWPIETLRASVTGG